MGFYITKILLKECKIEDQKRGLKDFHGNAIVLPARKQYKGRYKNRGDDRPMRYLIPTWSITTDSELKKIHFERDVLTIKDVRKLGIILFNPPILDKIKP